jgi:hypothetical protein
MKEHLAHKTIGSGNIWFMPGDVEDPVILAECKERLQVDSKGNKQITITKKMLDKIAMEAKMRGRYPTLPFRIKGEQDTFFISKFEVLTEMVHEIKLLRQEVDELTQERDTWKKTAEQLFAKTKEEGEEWE